MATITLRLALNHIAQVLSDEVKSLPEDFCSGFAYTTTGRNLTHPILLGAIAAGVRTLPGVRHVGVDVRLNVVAVVPVEALEVIGGIESLPLAIKVRPELCV